MKCSKCFDKLVKQNNNNVMKILKEIFKKLLTKAKIYAIINMQGKGNKNP